MASQLASILHYLLNILLVQIIILYQHSTAHIPVQFFVLWKHTTLVVFWDVTQRSLVGSNQNLGEFMTDSLPFHRD
jgi:phosphate starvation-inducible membrane PsiE